MTNTVQNDTVPTSLMDAMNGNRGGNKSAVQEAQDRFMTLLVTQMKNQDPLNPLDNAEITSQLAQLSTVTGIDRLNDTLQTIMGSVQSNQSLQAAGMIGHVVLSAGNNIDLYEDEGVFAFDLPASADSVKVTIRDAKGNAVREMNLGKQDVGLLELSWNGETDTGEVAAAGRYFFDVTAVNASGRVDAIPMAYNLVNSVSNTEDGIQMNLSNMQSVGMADIRQVF